MVGASFWCVVNGIDFFLKSISNCESRWNWIVHNSFIYCTHIDILLSCFERLFLFCTTMDLLGVSVTLVVNRVGVSWPSCKSYKVPTEMRDNPNFMTAGDIKSFVKLIWRQDQVELMKILCVAYPWYSKPTIPGLDL